MDGAIEYEISVEKHSTQYTAHYAKKGGHMAYFLNFPCFFPFLAYFLNFSCFFSLFFILHFKWSLTLKHFRLVKHIQQELSLSP